MRPLLAGLLLLLTACTSPADRALQRSPDFKAGYSDGCATAGSQDGANKRDETRIRDDDAYAKNPAYRSGWNSGMGACRQFTPAGGDRGPVPQPGLGGGATPF